MLQSAGNGMVLVFGCGCVTVSTALWLTPLHTHQLALHREYVLHCSHPCILITLLSIVSAALCTVCASSEICIMSLPMPCLNLTCITGLYLHQFS